MSEVETRRRPPVYEFVRRVRPPRGACRARGMSASDSGQVNRALVQTSGTPLPRWRSRVSTPVFPHALRVCLPALAASAEKAADCPDTSGIFLSAAISSRCEYVGACRRLSSVSAGWAPPRPGTTPRPTPRGRLKRRFPVQFWYSTTRRPGHHARPLRRHARRLPRHHSLMRGPQGARVHAAVAQPRITLAAAIAVLVMVLLVVVRVGQLM
jgi:hypothetical protein